MIQTVKHDLCVCQEPDVLSGRSDAACDIQCKRTVNNMFSTEVVDRLIRCIPCTKSVVYLTAVAVSCQEVINEVCRDLIRFIRRMADGYRI